MVKIRLLRAGAKKHAFYRIVVLDERRKRDGRPLDYLGTYDPNFSPAKIKLQTDRVEAWLGRGAQLSDTVRSLLRQVRRAAAPAGSGAA